MECLVQAKEKQLINSLPIDTQITLLQKEIKVLTNKPTKTKTEERVLETKKQELAELLNKQSSSNINNTKPSDRTGLYIGLGIIGVVLIGLALILVRKNKNKSKY